MKFKKHFCVLLAFFLLVSNTGYTFNVHFCGDKIASISIKAAFATQKTEEKCCPVIDVNKHCCNDKVLNFQKTVEQVILKSFSSEISSCVLISESKPVIFTALPNFKTNATPSYYCDAHAPPLFKLYQQYIFYDTI